MRDFNRHPPILQGCHLFQKWHPINIRSSLFQNAPCHKEELYLMQFLFIPHLCQVLFQNHYPLQTQQLPCSHQSCPYLYP